MMGSSTRSTRRKAASTKAYEPSPSPPPHEDDMSSTEDVSSDVEEEVAAPKSVLDAVLRERAAQASKEPEIDIVLKPNSNISTFLAKLYNLVSDKHSNDLIRWSDDGKSFFVLNPEKLTHDLIPRFFKHSNYASFVRQLNMYGFRKVSHVLQGALKSSTPDVTEFQNPNFIRGRPDLLEHVKRKTAGKKADSDVMDASEGQASSLTAVSGKDKIPSVELVLAELSNIKKTQQKIQNELRTIHQENEHIWKESQAQRLKHESQQVVINKILRFLASVFSSDKIKSLQGADLAAALASSSPVHPSLQRRQPLLLDSINSMPSSSEGAKIVPLQSPEADIAPDNLSSDLMHQRLLEFMQHEPSTISPADSFQDLSHDSHLITLPTTTADEHVPARLSHEIASLDSNINHLANNLGLKPDDLSNLDDLDPNMLNLFNFDPSHAAANDYYGPEGTLFDPSITSANTSTDMLAFSPETSSHKRSGVHITDVSDSYIPDPLLSQLQQPVQKKQKQ